MRTSATSFSSIIKNPITAVIFILTISFVLLFLPPRISNQIRMTCAAPVRPLQLAVCFCSNSASNFFERVITAWHDAYDKSQAEEQISQFKNKVIEQQDTIYKLQNKLQGISGFQAENKIDKRKPIPADIIGYDTSNLRKSIVINAGSKHGVKPDNVVVSNNALVGRVVTAGERNSIIQLITDPGSRIPGRVLQTRELVIVEGDSTGFCKLKYVPKWAKLKRGYDIVTSDVGGYYPPSLPVATVFESEIKSGNLFQSVKVLPKVDILKIESVLVITN